MERMSAEDPLCRVIEYALQQLCDNIVRGETGATEKQAALRRGFVRAINALPLCCSALHAQAKLHDGFESVLFYERVRVGLASPHYFLDGVPTGVQLFTGPTTIVLPDVEIRKLKLRDIIADRLQTVAKLEQMRVDLPRKVELVQNHHPEDLSDNVPGPVRVFIARCRAMCRAVRRLKREQLFMQCHNCNCNRLFYTGEVPESWCAAASSTPAGDSIEDADLEEETSSARYWEIAGGRAPSSVPATMRFCSEACKAEHARHLVSLMPDAGLTLDADDQATKVGRARVGEAFRIALKRNEMAARTLRLAKSRPRSHLAVSRQEAEAYRNQRITALNVDLGLLYASKLLAESAVMSRGKVLPGSAMYWRDDPSYYAKPLAEIVKIYAKASRKEGVVSSVLTVPRFMEVIGARVNRLF